MSVIWAFMNHSVQVFPGFQDLDPDIDFIFIPKMIIEMIRKSDP